MTTKATAAPEKDASDKNYYVTHLAEVNKTQAVISQEDVYSANGALLVKKGTRISQDVADKILKHKLLKPLEQQVNLADALNQTTLKQEFDALLAKYPDIGAIHKNFSYESKLKNLVFDSKLDSILYQKLTVLKERLPEVFEKSIFSAWWCGIVAQQLNLGIKPTQATFLAGLYHDVGLLHINPDVLYKKGQLSSEEWRAIQSHVVVGHVMFKNLSTSQDETARAILEHHECCDGTGYPVGKTGEALSVPGQILAMADTLQAVRINRFEKQGMNMRDALPFLHMNSTKHFISVYRAVCVLIMQAGLPITLNNHYGSHQKLVETLLSRVDVLQDAIVVLSMIHDLTEAEDKTPNQKRITVVTDPVLIMIQSSGIVRDELTLWLKKQRLQPDESVLRELLETDLMQTELLWQLKKAVRVVNEYTDTHPVLSETQRNHLKKLSDYIYASLANDGAH
jgi:HD-GYP domain-containing protein (c-di-GMP phosphodiesterase class II)